MADTSDNTDQILYDLLVQAEWQLEAEPVSQAEKEFWREKGPLHWKFWKLSQITLNYLLQTVRSSIRLSTSFGCPPINFSNIFSKHLPWNISLAKNGRLLAVLTDEAIEVRSFKDSFSSVIAKCQVGTDPFPQWRRIAWNQNGSFLAFASSFGDVSVFDTSGSLLYKIKRHGPSMNLPTGFSNCLCALFFTESAKSNEWEFDLVCITYHGVLHRYLLSNSSYKEDHTFSFTRCLPAGVATATFSPKHSLLVVVGFEGDEPFSDESGFSGARAGITLWRQLSDAPHYAIVDTGSKNLEELSKRNRLREFKWKASNLSSHGVYKCCLSPNEDTIVTLHQNGRIAIWRMPSLNLQRTWSLSEQPSSDTDRNAYLLHEMAHIDSDRADISNFMNINWWSEEAIICARRSGSVVVSSTKGLENLLGQSEEMFEPWPCITDACDGQFLVLECEKKIKRIGESSNLNKDDSEEYENDNEAENVMTRISKICKQTLYFLTESDNFKPPSKQIRLMQRIYRLIALQSTTPEELYARKIDLEEYGEALELAQRFGLDTNLVYQRQWAKSPTTVISIKDYLSKINNRFWVLNECVTRVPEDVDAMKNLLQYGFLGTSIKVIQSIDTDAALPFVSSQDRFGADDDDDDDNDDDDDKQASNKANRLFDVLSSLKLESMTEKQVHLCRYRWQILQYLDRLETYEIILGGPFRAAERYKPDFFLQFRCCNIIDQAIEYARTSCSEPLEELFTYHGTDVLPHWLAILSNFPETTPVSSYRRLLPFVSESESGGMVIEEWKELKHRESDWVEADVVKRHIIKEENDEDPSAFIYDEQPNLLAYRSCNDIGLLANWFVERAHEIESRTNLVDNALSLIEHGIENGIQGLTEIRDNLNWLSVLAYEVNIEPVLSLAEFEKLSNLDKLRLLMSKSTEETFLKDYQRWASRFMAFVGKSRTDDKWKLLKRYLTDVAKSDLTFPLKIFEKSVPGCDEPLIPDVAKLMKLAIDCICICKRDDQLDLAFKIVECLPTREDSHLSSQIDDLHDKVDHLEQYLRGSEILQLYSIPKPVLFLVNTEGDVKSARDIFTTLCRNASRKKPALTPNDWNMFLKHILQLREEVYGCISKSELYKIFVSHLLCSGMEENLHLAKELLTVVNQRSKEDRRCAQALRAKKPVARLINSSFVLPYDDSVNLVLDAAKEYFNSGSNLADWSIDLARKSLCIIEDSPPMIQFELDLIAALGILFEFDVNILPLQVRHCENKLDLIRAVVSSGSTAYKKTAKIHKLAKLLQISQLDEKERLGKVTTILAEAAIENEDLPFAKDMCLSLLDLNYSPGWNVCRSLCESDKFGDLEAKQKLVGFSLTFCSPDQIEPLLVTRNLIETQIIYGNLSKESINSSEGETESDDAVLDSTDGQASSSLLNRTQKKLTSKTKSIISNVSDTNWWKSQAQWVSGFEKSSSTSPSQANRKEGKPIRMVYHPFYARRNDAVMKDFDQGLQSIFDLDTTDQRLLVNSLLIRSQKLSESRAEGTISEPSIEVMIQLAESELYHDTMMFLAYILSLDKVMDAEELFEKFHGDPLVLQLVAYLLAIESESNASPNISNSSSHIYSKCPSALIAVALKAADSRNDGVIKTRDAMRKYLLILSDFVQAKTLDDLGKGVDIKRFMQDNEYKRETVLGLAMTLEGNLLSVATSLAEKYDLPSWEVLCAHVEFLLTDSGLKVKEIQERLNKLDIVSAFRDNGSEVLERIRTYVYPYIDGTEHALLLIVFTLIQQCCGYDAIIEGSMDVASHIRALKRIKSAAPGLNYKELIHGSSALDVVRDVLTDVLMESNVHVLAKLVPKITGTDGKEGVSSREIFAAYMLKSFWQGHKKVEDSEVQWLHRFESVQKEFSKVSAQHLVTFTNDITLSERAVDSVPRDTRLNIIKRVLKYVRQQKAQEERRIDNDSGPEALTFSAAEIQLEKSYNHIKSLDSELFLSWLQSDNEKEQGYARRLELSGSDLSNLSELAKDLFLDLRSPEEVSEIFTYCSIQGKLKTFVAEAFREALTCVTATLVSPHDIHKSPFASMIDLVSDHLENDGELLSQEDVLMVVRPICTNFEIRTDLKMELLQILEKSFELDEDDIFLLVYYQSDAIIGATWARKISPDDINSEEKRYDLFFSLIGGSEDTNKLESLGKLLLAWPVFAGTEQNQHLPSGNPWIALFMRMIDERSMQKLLELFKLALHKATFSFECLMDLHQKLVTAGCKIEALKLALISENAIFMKEGFKLFHSNDADDSCKDNDLFQAIIATKTISEAANTSLFPLLMDYVVSHSKNEVFFNNVVMQLKLSGLEMEAGTLILRTSKFHSALATADIAISSFINWFQR